MKRTDVTLGGEFLAKIKTQWVGVRIEGARTNGGWDARILATGKVVRI